MKTKHFIFAILILMISIGFINSLRFVKPNYKDPQKQAWYLWNKIQDGTKFPSGTRTFSFADTTFVIKAGINYIPTSNRKTLKISKLVKSKKSLEFTIEYTPFGWWAEIDGEKSDDSGDNLFPMDKEKILNLKYAYLCYH